MALLSITDDNFETEVLQSDMPVLIDFWAVWCGPCKIIKPVVEELAVEYDGKMKFGELDVDQNQQSAMKYGVRSIPTLLIFKNGEVADTIIGAQPKAQIEKKINEVL